KGSLEPSEELHFSPAKLRTQLMLSVATSIDALAFGISFACIGYNTFSALTFPLVLIGMTSLLFGIVGHILGISFGRGIAHKLKPELFGGIILMLIGIKILLTHLL
ncbi:MAG: manganese efflux pump, partial [Prevotella sp.]